MYEIKTLPAGELLDWLNSGNREVIYADRQDQNWTVLVKSVRMGRPPKAKLVEVEPPPPIQRAAEALNPNGFPMRFKDEA